MYYTRTLNIGDQVELRDHPSWGRGVIIVTHESSYEVGVSWAHKSCITHEPPWSLIKIEKIQPGG